jgi:hypothetical protein
VQGATNITPYVLQLKEPLISNFSLVFEELNYSSLELKLMERFALESRQVSLSSTVSSC